MSRSQIYYSHVYRDDQYEYRHVVLPREMAKYVPKSHLMSEDEWRQLGVQQSQGWVHYMIHEPGMWEKKQFKGLAISNNCVIEPEGKKLTCDVYQEAIRT